MEDKNSFTANEAQPWIDYGTIGTVAATSSLNTQQPVIPVGVPQNVEMALRDIEEGEKEFERGDTFTHQEVMKMVWDKISRNMRHK